MSQVVPVRAFQLRFEDRVIKPVSSIFERIARFLRFENASAIGGSCVADSSLLVPTQFSEGVFVAELKRTLPEVYYADGGVILCFLSPRAPR